MGMGRSRLRCGDGVRHQARRITAGSNIFWNGNQGDRPDHAGWSGAMVAPCSEPMWLSP